MTKSVTNSVNITDGQRGQLFAALEESGLFPYINTKLNPTANLDDRLMSVFYYYLNVPKGSERITDRFLGRGALLTAYTVGPGTHFVNKGAVPAKNVFVEEQRFPVPEGHAFATVAAIAPHPPSLRIYDFVVNPQGEHILQGACDVEDGQHFDYIGNTLQPKRQL